jgi:hypothetical protein
MDDARHGPARSRVLDLGTWLSLILFEFHILPLAYPFFLAPPTPCLLSFSSLLGLFIPMRITMRFVFPRFLSRWLR